MKHNVPVTATDDGDDNLHGIVGSFKRRGVTSQKTIFFIDIAVNR
jgi:hypothetical protein